MFRTECLRTRWDCAVRAGDAGRNGGLNGGVDTIPARSRACRSQVDAYAEPSADTVVEIEEAFTDLYLAPSACTAPAPVAFCLPEGAECLPGIDVCCSGFCFTAAGETRAHCHG